MPSIYKGLVLIEGMGKLDGMRYPAKITAEEAVNIARVLVDEFDGEVRSKEMFADALGHSTANSGSYISKVADARSYGILPKQGLKATDLTYRVAHPKDNTERREAIFEMYQNVEILSKLYNHLDGNEPPSRLWSVLIEISEANRSDAKGAADDIRTLYEAMLEYDVDEKSDPEQTESRESSEESATVVQSSNPVDEGGIFLKVDGDEHHFSEINDLNIEIAIRILQSKREGEAHPDDENGLVQSKLDK